MVLGKVGDANVEETGGGWYLECWLRVGALDDGMLPVNTAGSPGGGLQWPSRDGVDVAELAMQKVWMQMLWIQLVWQLVAVWSFRSVMPLRSAGLALFGQGLPSLVPEGLLLKALGNSL